MAREDARLAAAKRSYRNAKDIGNRQEEARWANVIGDILKNRGEYVESLKWLRIDYDISTNYLPEKHLLPTCQSLGEIYLRLEEFKDALIYQKRHLQLAEDTCDLVEEQRACTQLGRTYYDMFLKSEDDHDAIRNAKKYFKSAMRLAKTLKDSPPSSRSSFLKEFVDAHNNLGMLELELDNLEAAHEILIKGLQICDEEELSEEDDARSRLHHNLGNVYMELRKWDKAKEHIEKDIKICHRIGHCQGEAKGYINLGELHSRVQRYEEANLCYGRALRLAKSMEDEDALVHQIEQNINIANEAMKVMDELTKEERNLKKLTRHLADAKGTADERKCLLQLNASLDCLIEKSSTIAAWVKHREYAKRKKRIGSELCDKEKLSDSFLAVGESYHKLRNFNKAHKWYTKSWEGYKSIGNLEGQALAKINIGNVLDSVGDWRRALNAFEEAYGIALEANLLSVQLSALENMHYSQMIRFENVDEARRLRLKIDKLKESKCGEMTEHATRDSCSETDTEGNENLSDSQSNVRGSLEMHTSDSHRSKSLFGEEVNNDDVPLISLVQSRKRVTRTKTDKKEKHNFRTNQSKALPPNKSELSGSQQTVVGRKRIRVILSDDESEADTELEFPKSTTRTAPASPRAQDVSTAASKHTTGSSNPVNIEESACSYKSLSPKAIALYEMNSRSLINEKGDAAADFDSSWSRCDAGDNMWSNNVAACVNSHSFDSNEAQFIMFKVGNDLLHMAASSCTINDKLSLEALKVELACLYYLKLPLEKKSKGLLPIFQHMECGGRVLESHESYESLKDSSGNLLIEASVEGWVQKRLMKIYIDCCKKLSEAPNMKLLKKLYSSEIEDEVNLSECELQDISVSPLLEALQVHNTVAVLDLSHNFLGNGTMEKLKQLFASSSQRYGDLILDLHFNRFGPTALFQICECPVLFTRLEVLNVSGNRLTDSCGSYLSTILKNCKALYSLNIERCSLTSRTITKVADTLGVESALSQLCIGYNNPVSKNVIQNLLAKLATLRSFSELSMNGINLSSQIADSLSELVKTSSLSRLMLGGSGLGTVGATKLIESFHGSQETVKLDLSCCGLTTPFFLKLTSGISLVSSIIELNVGGNSITEEGIKSLALLLMNPRCCLKALILNNCQLGLSGMLRIIQVLSGNNNLEELNLADNAEMDTNFILQNDQSAKVVVESEKQDLGDIKDDDEQQNMCLENDQDGLCLINTECNNLEVADSEDEETKGGAAASRLYANHMSLNVSCEWRLFKEVSSAISMAKHLQVLDLSDNGFCTQASEKLYISWSSRIGARPARRHIKDRTVHFSVEGKDCCPKKPCCRRD